MSFYLILNDYIFEVYIYIVINNNTTIKRKTDLSKLCPSPYKIINARYNFS